MGEPLKRSVRRLILNISAYTNEGNLNRYRRLVDGSCRPVRVSPPNSNTFWLLNLALVPVALALLILSIIALVKDKKRIWPAVSIALVLLVSFIALTKLMRWGALANFYLNRAHYEATAKTVLAAPTNQREQLCGDNCWIMSTDPPRVAFHYIHGFLNWHDIVYDPSGAVIQAKSYDERKQLNLYFGTAEQLTGDWYLCHFCD